MTTGFYLEEFLREESSYINPNTYLLSYLSVSSCMWFSRSHTYIHSNDRTSGPKYILVGNYCRYTPSSIKRIQVSHQLLNQANEDGMALQPPPLLDSPSETHGRRFPQSTTNNVYGGYLPHSRFWVDKSTHNRGAGPIVLYCTWYISRSFAGTFCGIEGE